MIKQVQPESYDADSDDGNDIELSPGIISSVETFPELKAHKGEDIIVTDGTTLLGAAL